MIVKYNGKSDYFIKSIADFINWLNYEFKTVHQFVNVPNNKVLELIENMILESTSISKTKLRQSIRIHMFNSSFPVQVKYWLNRGYSELAAAQKIKDFQASSSKSFSNKRKLYPEKYTGIIPSQLEYWINKGYSEKDAKIKLAERQATFSLEKCIKKYGPTIGVIKFNERQKKWVTSIRAVIGVSWETSQNNSGGFSNQYLFDKYGESWLMVKLKSYKNRNRVHSATILMIEKINEIVYVTNGSLIKYLMTLDLFDLDKYSKSSIVKFILKLTSIEIKSIWCKANGVKFKKSTHGNMYWVNGKFYKSIAEFEIGKFLSVLNLDFENNKRYPNSQRVYDFYLPKFDLYIEWMGMKKNEYLIKMKALSRSNYRIIWTNNFTVLKNKIYEENNKYKEIIRHRSSY
jgi:hypothetical protein